MTLAPVEEMPPLDPDQLLHLVEQRAWVPIAALVIGILVRLAKSDTKLPIDIPPTARYWVALCLGILSGVLEKVVASGTSDRRTWTSAIVGGLVSAALAVLAHDGIVGSLRGGKEIPIPGLTIPGARPAPDKPITIPPEAPPSEPRGKDKEPS